MCKSKTSAPYKPRKQTRMDSIKNEYDYDSDKTYSSDVLQTEYAVTLTLTDKQTVNTIDGQHLNRIYAKIEVLDKEYNSNWTQKPPATS